MIRSDLCDFSDAYIVVKREITVTNLIQIMQKEIKQLRLKIMHHLSTVFQRLMV